MLVFRIWLVEITVLLVRLWVSWVPLWLLAWVPVLEVFRTNSNALRWVILTSIFLGLGLSGAAAVAAASELPLSPHGDIPPHPDQLTESSGLGDQGTRLSPDNHIVTCFSWLSEFFQTLHAFAALLFYLHVPTVYQLCLYLWGCRDVVCSDLSMPDSFALMYVFHFHQICWVALVRGRTIRPQPPGLQGAPMWINRASHLISLKKSRRTGLAVAALVVDRPVKMIKEINEEIALETEARALAVDGLEVAPVPWVRGHSIGSQATSPIDRKRRWNLKKIMTLNRQTSRYYIP